MCKTSIFKIFFPCLYNFTLPKKVPIGSGSGSDQKGPDSDPDPQPCANGAIRVIETLSVIDVAIKKNLPYVIPMLRITYVS